jgi:hypothetical protein
MIRPFVTRCVNLKSAGPEGDEEPSGKDLRSIQIRLARMSVEKFTEIDNINCRVSKVARCNRLLVHRSKLRGSLVQFDFFAHSLDFRVLFSDARDECLHICLQLRDRDFLLLNPGVLIF